MKLKPWQLSVTLICLITGLFISYNFRVQSALRSSPNLSTASLADMVEAAEKENAAREAEIVTLRQQLETQQKAQLTNTSLQGLHLQLDKAKLISGLTTLEGPGVELTLNDRNLALDQARKAGIEINYWDYLVHDSDLVKLVNDLKSGGAEAISINGERLITPSDIKCGGYIIYSNGTRLGAPYVVAAIGNPEQLIDALQRGSTFSTLAFLEYPISVKRVDKAVIPAFKGSLKLNYAEVFNINTRPTN